MQGKVKWFNNEKVLDLSKLKALTMYSYISLLFKAEGYKALEEGQEVSFDITEGNRGPQAANVVKL